MQSHIWFGEASKVDRNYQTVTSAATPVARGEPITTVLSVIAAGVVLTRTPFSRTLSNTPAQRVR
jgi:hypothetical protein